MHQAVNLCPQGFASSNLVRRPLAGVEGILVRQAGLRQAPGPANRKPAVTCRVQWPRKPSLLVARWTGRGL